MKFIKKVLLKKELVFAWIILFLIIIHFNKQYKKQSPVVTSDGYYYYLYLPALFFTSCDFGPFYKVYNAVRFEKNIKTDKWENGFNVGSAVLWSPFFLSAHILYGKKFESLPPYQRAFGTPYERFVCKGTFIYVWIGFILLFIWLLKKFNPLIALLAVLSMATASFMPWYYIKEPGMSHGNIFFICSILIVFWFWGYGEESVKTRELWKYFIAGIILGIASATRLQVIFYSVIFILEFVRLIYQEKKNLKPILKRIILNSILLFIGFVIGFLPQMLSWKYIYGTYFTFPQGKNFIQYGRPLISNILFSSRNGLFTWSPIMYLATLSLLWLPIKMKFRGFILLSVIILQFYLNSCIEDWWCGYSFSLRRMASELPIWTIGLAFTYSFINEQIQKRPYLLSVIVISGIFLLFYFFNPAVNLSISEWSKLTSRSIPLDSLYSKVFTNRFSSIRNKYGTPLCFPINYIYSWKYGITPKEYETIIGQYFLDEEHNYGTQLSANNPEHYKFIRSEMIEVQGMKNRISAEPKIRILIPLLFRTDLKINVKFSEDSELTSQSLSLIVNNNSIKPDYQESSNTSYIFHATKNILRNELNTLVVDLNQKIFPKTPVVLLRKDSLTNIWIAGNFYPLNEKGCWLIYCSGGQRSINLFSSDKDFSNLINFLNILITQKRNSWDSLAIYSKNISHKNKIALLRILNIPNFNNNKDEFGLIVDENGYYFIEENEENLLCSNLPIIKLESIDFKRTDNNIKTGAFK